MDFQSFILFLYFLHDKAAADHLGGAYGRFKLK